MPVRRARLGHRRLRLCSVAEDRVTQRVSGAAGYSKRLRRGRCGVTDMGEDFGLVMCWPGHSPDVESIRIYIV